MGIPVFILGQSGTGKSTSLRNFKSDEILHINVMSKPLPFKGRFAETYNGDDYKDIAKKMNETKKKVIVIDDAQYLMANEFMRRSFEKGYDKFTEIGYNFWTLVSSINEGLPYDVIVYFLMHTAEDDQGNEKAKTIGKLLDEKITLEGMTSIVLKTAVKDAVYSFLTQNNGHDTVKSPLGMFKTYEIENDLKMVDETIRDYWELDVPFESQSELMAEHDAEVDAGGVSTDAPKPEKKSRRKRGEITGDGEGKTLPEVKNEERIAEGDDTIKEGIEEKPVRRRRNREVNPDDMPKDMIPEEDEKPEEAEKPVRRRRRRD